MVSEIIKDFRFWIADFGFVDRMSNRSFDSGAL
jgi:hypothetical protein